jgi:hypothetical protein
MAFTYLEFLSAIYFVHGTIQILIKQNSKFCPLASEHIFINMTTLSSLAKTREIR